VNASDHFERLGLPRRFSVDPTAIEREYLARSRSFHPDFHHAGTAAQQRASLEMTAALNEAYLTLKDPLRRAEYLLQLLGGPTAREEKNLDQEFLMTMMDHRERIEEARRSDPAALTTIEAELHTAQAERLRRVEKLFDRLDELPLNHPDRPALLSAIRQDLNAVKTLQSLLRDLHLD
jgi:molecular chaperone HscB